VATRNFTDDELRCQCGCGQLNPDPRFVTFMDRVQILRGQYGNPLGVSSAYRCPKHPIEARKETGGQHTIAAIDLSVSRSNAHEVLRLAFAMGFTGIGVNQKGGHRFIHLDDRVEPNVWSY
jgi:uncharacterized protein YcbK (DUF882 family)